MINDSTAKSATMVGDGTQTRFDFTFDPLDSSYVRVWEGETVVTSGYSVTVTGSTNYVTFTTPPDDGVKVVITRNVPVTQLVDLQNQTAFYPEVLEGSYDKLTAICQQLKETSERSVVFPPTFTINAGAYERFLELMGSTSAFVQYDAGFGLDITGRTIYVDTSEVVRPGDNVDVSGVQTTCQINAWTNRYTFDTNLFTTTDGGTASHVKTTSVTLDTTKVQEKITAGDNLSFDGTTLNAWQLMDCSAHPFGIDEGIHNSALPISGGMAFGLYSGSEGDVGLTARTISATTLTISSSDKFVYISFSGTSFILSSGNTVPTGAVMLAYRQASGYPWFSTHITAPIAMGV